MKQFNLEEYLKNPSRKVITRDSRSVRIVCTDMIGTVYPILAICRIDPTHDYYIQALENLVLVHVQILIFSLLRKNMRDGDDYHTSVQIPYLSKSEAISHIMKNDDYVRTVKVEWED